MDGGTRLLLVRLCAACLPSLAGAALGAGEASS